MKPNRRRFLGLLGVGAATSPLAAKAALDEGIAKQAGVGQFVGGNLISTPPSMGSGVCSDTPWHLRHIGAFEYVKAFGLPSVIEESYRLNSRYVQSLDPDIACKRSWSMSVKIMTQRQRNYQFMVDGLERTASHMRRKGVVEKILGFEWPW